MPGNDRDVREHRDAERDECRAPVADDVLSQCVSLVHLPAEEILDLVEHSTAVRRILSFERSKLLEQFVLLIGERRRNPNVDVDVVIAPARSLKKLNALSL